jgi:hypothetical protein
MKCDWCGSIDLRASRFRLRDLPRLLIFQYPARCRSCHRRSFHGFFSVLKITQASNAHSPAGRSGVAFPAPRHPQAHWTVKCRSCGSANLRTSRFQLPDLSHLLRLQYPVRCRSCRERSYRFLFLLWKIPSPARAHRTESEVEGAPRGF